MDLTLYFHPLSSYCWKVLIALHEGDIPFTPHHLDLGDPAARAAFTSLWPIGKMPVLVAGDAVIPEATIIVEYLATHFRSAARLVPAEAGQAAEVRLTDRFYDLYVHTPMQKIVGDRLRDADQRDPFGVQEARTMLATACAMADRQMVSRKWAAGDDFTMADCAAAPALFYADKIQPLADRFPAARAYLDRLKSRPSIARTLERAEPYSRSFPTE